VPSARSQAAARRGFAGIDESAADALLGLPDAAPPPMFGMDLAQQASPLRPPRPSSESLRGKSPEEVEVALMERLRKYVK
jgi:hypothetical protein